MDSRMCTRRRAARPSFIVDSDVDEMSNDSDSDLEEIPAEKGRRRVAEVFTDSNDSDSDLEEIPADKGRRRVAEVFTDSSEDEDEQAGRDEVAEGDEQERAEPVNVNERLSTLRKNHPFRPLGEDFQEEPFIKNAAVDADSKPLEIVRKILTEDVVDEILIQTNLFADFIKANKSRALRGWKEISEGEFWQFLGLSLMMGIVRKPAVRDYWETDPLFETPGFRTKMSRNRFQEIQRALHFVNNATIPANNQNRFLKLGTVFPAIFGNIKTLVTPGRDLTIDESLLAFKGRLGIKQYCPLKRARFGIKIFFLADAKSGYIYDALPYQGKGTSMSNSSWIAEYGFGGAAVLTLLNPFLKKWHRVTIDNFFVSLKLAHKLLECQTHLLGTVKVTRKGIPKMGRKLKKGEVEVFSDGTVLLERWSDRRQVLMLNTFIPHKMTFATCRNPFNDRHKPDSVLYYNKTMGAVDGLDRTVKPFQCVRKSYKYYKKIFFYAVDITMYNSRVLYNSCREQKEKLLYQDFLKQVIREIFEAYPPNLPQRGRPSNIQPSQRLQGSHIPEKKIGSTGKSSFQDCVLCRKSGVRKATQYSCRQCGVRLCVRAGNQNCFSVWHSLREIPSKKRREIEGDQAVPGNETEEPSEDVGEDELE